MVLEIQNNLAQINDTEKKQNWDRFQAQYGEKPKAQRQVKKSLDKDDFLKIMITQMQHQNPSEPFAADKLAQEIAQIASVEQLSNVNKALEGLAKKNDPLERLTMTHLIGKTVTVDPNRFSHTSGFQSNIPFQLTQDAESVKVSVISSKGEVVYSQDIGSQKSGKNSFLWNGIKENTLPAETDLYMVKVDALSKDGQVIPIQATQKTKIIGVSFSGAEPSFVVGDAQNNSKIPMKNIIQIEEAESNTAMEAGATAPLPSVSLGDKPNNVFQMAAQNAQPKKPVQNIENSAENKTNEPKVLEKGFPSGFTPPLEKGKLE